MGLNSGEVVVGKIGDDLRMDYTAQGNTVGLAQRMEQIAESGRIYVTEHTQGLVRGYFRLRELGASQIKGVRRPVHVFELEGTGTVRTRIEASRLRGLTRFVGRQDEMATLEAALSRAREGQGAVVGVVGKAGVGKSRLCLEFVERCRAQGLPVYEAHCPAHGKAVPYLPILELFRNYFGIAEGDAPAQARRKIAGALLLLDTELRDALPVLFEFLGVGDPEEPATLTDPEARKRQLFALIHRVSSAQNERGLVSVVLIDDLHWIDSGSDAFVAQLVEATEGSRTFLLLNFRPEYEAAWTRRAHYQQLPLVPLGSAAVRELVESLLGTDPSVSQLPAQIEQWTEGNPFFTEEVIQTLVEGGELEGAPGAYRLREAVERLKVPSTVQAVLAARIDRLPASAKLGLQTAAVIGKQFTAPLLEAVANLPPGELDSALDRLKTGDFIYERALYPVEEYAFKHPLTQEVAYHSQLNQQRARIHAAVAQAIERRDPDRLDENAALIAHHYEAAGKSIDAARWHVRAAEWLIRTDAPAALRHWKAVRSLADEAPDERGSAGLRLQACAQILGIGWRVHLPEAEAENVFEEGRRLAQELGDLPRLAHLEATYGAILFAFLRIEDAANHLRRARSYVERPGHEELRAALSSIWIRLELWRGNHQEARRICEATLSCTGGDPHFGAGILGISPKITASHELAIALEQAGSLKEACQRYEATAREAEEEGFSENLAWVLADYSVSLSFRDPEAAIAAGRRAIETANRVGSGDAKIMAMTELGWIYATWSRWPEAAEVLRAASALVPTSGMGRCFELWIIPTLTWAVAELDGAEQGLEDARRAYALARTQGLGWVEILGGLSLARGLLALGSQHHDEADRTISALEPKVATLECHFLTPLVVEARARSELQRGKPDACAESLRVAHRLFAELGATAHAKRVARELTGNSASS